MDQNSNYITIEMTFRLSMLCRAPHTICYGKRWIMWTVLLIKVISSLYGHIATHKSNPALPPSEVPAATEENYGLTCETKNAQEVITSIGYNDLTFNVTVPCGAPSKNGKFKSLSLRFHFIQSELEGDLHAGCIENVFEKPEFGWRDPIIQCGH